MEENLDDIIDILNFKPPQDLKLTAVQMVSRYLVFRPYTDPMSVRPQKPQDKGFYFKNYNNVNVPLVRFTLEDNGFREAERGQDWSICWACSNIKS